jgi:signal transduction histidine kinase
MSIIFVHFLFGLAFFSLGLAVILEARHASRLVLSRHLLWLAGFGFTQCLFIWADLFLVIYPEGPTHLAFLGVRSFMLPFSALLLLRFGFGLMKEAGPLPEWMSLVPVMFILPAGLLLGYAAIIFTTEPPYALAIDVWSRYLIYLPANLLAGYAFIRQWRRLPGEGITQAQGPLLGVVAMFALNAIASGLVAPQAPYALAGFLNEELITAAGVNIQVWRALIALGITFYVVWALGIFETERRQQLARMDEDRTQAQNSAMQAQTEARHRAESWRDSLVQINREIANLTDVDDLLLQIIQASRRLLNADAAMLGLWDEDGKNLLVKGIALRDRARITPALAVENQPLLQALHQREPYRYVKSSPAPAGMGWTCPFHKVDAEAAALVPLEIEGRSLGGLWVVRLSHSPFTESDLQGLEHMADQVVIVIEQALMAGRLQSVAVLEERSRIAREMHDGLAQVLGYMGLEMQTLEALARQGNQDLLLDELQRARENIALTQADVRENILSLRTTLAGEAGLVAALEEYVDEFGVQTGIETRFVCDCDGTPSLSPMAETQLVRITQEALSNVRKHAQATQVQVRLSHSENLLCVTITDNGIGVTDPPERGHFGLITMRERAESAGGSLTITSQLGEGVEVNLWLPLVTRPADRFNSPLEGREFVRQDHFVRERAV